MMESVAVAAFLLDFRDPCHSLWFLHCWPALLLVQDEKDWLRQQLQLASEGGSASEARLQEKEQHIKSLQ